MTRLVYILAYGLFLLTALGCATLKSVFSACAPASSQETALVMNILDNQTLTNLEDTAKLEASGIALCVITQLAKDALAVKFAATGPSIRATHSRAWLEVHP